MNSPVEEIKSRIDIAELIGSYVRLNRGGANLKGLCPFHKEKTPSFSVSPARQIWRCFGCGKGGDHFTFVMEMEGLEFPEALRILADRAGVRFTREDPRIRSERNRLYDCLEEAASYFQKNLVSVPAALAYLKQRGVLDRTIADFRIGFSFDAWDALLKHLKTLGYQEGEIEKAGLAIKGDSGGWYDRFRGRIIFPISDAHGRVVGFGGRIFESAANQEKQRAGSRETETAAAKYINTPQTLTYDKSRILYAFDKAKNAIREKNSCVIVEGYMDAVMSHQVGVVNAVAVSGTALTPEQLKMIRRLADTVISSFDRDQAGVEATKRSLDLASEFDFERKAAVLPKGMKDPADAALAGADVWRKAVEDALPIVQFYFQEAFAKHNPETAGGVKAIVTEVLPEIRGIVNDVEKAYWVGKVAGSLRVSEEAVWRELAKAGVGTSRGYREANADAAPFEKTRRETLEELALGALSLYRQFIPQYAFLSRRFLNHTHQEIFRALSLGSDAALPPDLSLPLQHCAFRAEIFLEPAEQKEAAIESLLREFTRESLRFEQGSLAREISDAEKNGNNRLLEERTKAYQAVCEELRRAMAQSE